MEIQDLEQRIRSLAEGLREQEDFYRSMRQLMHQAHQNGSLCNQSLPSLAIANTAK